MATANHNRVEKEVRLNYTRRRANVSVVREHYLRTDISCKSSACRLCTRTNTLNYFVLNSEASHYLIPDGQTLAVFLELFESPVVTNLILMETTLAIVRSMSGRRSYLRAVSLLSSPLKHTVLFSNEHHMETFTARREGESQDEWQRRLLHKATQWYAKHLKDGGSSVSPVLISMNPEDHRELEGVLVIGVMDYIEAFLPDEAGLKSICQSIDTSLRDSDKKGGVGNSGFADFISQVEIEKGLSAHTLVQGCLCVNSHKQAYVKNARGCGGTERDILICGAENRNRAIHGDFVVVKVSPRNPSTLLDPQDDDSLDLEQPNLPAVGHTGALTSGKVVAVLERRSWERDYVATFAEDDKPSRGGIDKVLVIPYNRCIPRIRIATRQLEELKSHRLLVRIDCWDVSSNYPSGHLVRSLGAIGELETEMTVILIENRLLCSPFSKKLLSELPRDTPEQPWRADLPGGMEGRKDLRESHLVFSIDPKGCEDVDDALSVRQLNNGVTELGVHIADVSFFVHPGSLTDIEAHERSTTVYLADRRYDMLPSLLSANLCSLLSERDRYAVSVTWRFDKQKRIKEVWYGRTLIRSSYKLTYETAQAIHDGVSASVVVKDIPELYGTGLTADETRKKIHEIGKSVSVLMELANILKRERKERGAVELESVDVNVELGEGPEGTEISDLIPKQTLNIHETVAECMILANHWVAKRIVQAFPHCALLRHHPPPRSEGMEFISSLAATRGFTIDSHSNKSLASSLDSCVDPRDPSINKLFRSLTVYVMMNAEYISSASVPRDNDENRQDEGESRWYHYGLALSHYTHFTSPIRRYADLVVHRQLLAALKLQKIWYLDTKILKEGMMCNRDLAEHMNSKHKASQNAQRASVQFFQTLYFDRMQGEGSCITTGVVYSIKSSRVMVFVPRYGIRGPVYIRDKNNQVIQPHPSEEKLVYAPGSVVEKTDCLIVVYDGGHYKISLLDHFKVCVCVERSYSHASSLWFQLVHFKPVPVTQDLHKTEIPMEITKKDGDGSCYDHGLTEGEREYKSSDPTSSLYCIMQGLYQLSLKENCARP